MMFKISKFKAALALVLVLPLFCSSVFAYESHRNNHWGDSRIDRHYYREGRWYHRGPSGIEIAVAALALGAYVETLPPRYTTVVVQGTPYYYDGTTYYSRYANGGYVVVQAPMQVVPQRQMQETLTINIPNSRNGFTSVTLRRSGNGFIGPQGEYYPGSPSVRELRALYGR